jgi:anti-anti-sigma factor
MMMMETKGSVLRVAGLAHLNAKNCLDLKDRIRATLNDDHREVVLDLDGLGIIDSCVLGAFVGIHKLVTGRAGSLRLVNPSPAVMQVIELTRMHRILICIP